jgi:hypothetical protein
MIHGAIPGTKRGQSPEDAAGPKNRRDSPAIIGRYFYPPGPIYGTLIVFINLYPVDFIFILTYIILP